MGDAPAGSVRFNRSWGSLRLRTDCSPDPEPPLLPPAPPPLLLPPPPLLKTAGFGDGGVGSELNPRSGLGACSVWGAGWEVVEEFPCSTCSCGMLAASSCCSDMPLRGSAVSLDMGMGGIAWAAGRGLSSAARLEEGMGSSSCSGVQGSCFLRLPRSKGAAEVKGEAEAEAEAEVGGFGLAKADTDRPPRVVGGGSHSSCAARWLLFALRDAKAEGASSS